MILTGTVKHELQQGIKCVGVTRHVTRVPRHGQQQREAAALAQLGTVHGLA